MFEFLLVAAVDAEREALQRRTDALSVIATGAGPAAAGTGGGFAPRAPVGSVVVSTRTVPADLGADSPDGFLPISELGFAPHVAGPDEEWSQQITTTLTGAGLNVVKGAVLSVSTVTGTAARTADLAARHPDAAAEGMEGYGVATAATMANVPFVEIRTISNAVGPRDRGSWRIDEALDLLAVVGESLAGLQAP